MNTRLLAITSLIYAPSKAWKVGQASACAGLQSRNAIEGHPMNMRPLPTTSNQLNVGQASACAGLQSRNTTEATR
jgi:hypothetical protein